MLLDERPTTMPDASTSYAERSATAEARELLVATGLLGLVLVASLAVQSVLPTVIGVALACVAAVVLTMIGATRLTPTITGGLVWGVGCAATTVAILELADTKQHTVAWSLVMTGIVATLPTLHWARQQVAAGATPAAVVADAAKAFTLPTTGVAATLIGAGVALPLVGTYAPLIGDPDSAWFVTSTQDVQRNGIGLLKETHDVFVPHLTIGPLLALDGYRAAIPFMILTLMALSALTAYLAYRLTHQGAGALAASAALISIPSILERADRLPMYAAAFFFAYGAGWLLHRAMSDEETPWWFPFAAGVGLVLAYESHGVGQIFAVVPFLLLLLHPWRRARRPFLLTFLTMAVGSIPRVVVNLSVDGLANFRTNYADFMIQKHLPIVNRDFWEHNNDTTALGYVTNLPEMTEKALGSQAMLLLLLVPVALAALRSEWRARLFVGTSAALFIAALAVNSPGTFGRYLTPLAVGFALVAAVGVTKALRAGSEARLLGRIVLSVLTLAAFLQLVDSVSVSADQRNVLEGGSSTQLAAAIDDDKAVIGVRPHQLLWTEPGIPTAYARTMTEEDWVTYLSWPSDENVTEMLDRYDVGWVYVMPDHRLEVEYHETWLEPVYGLTVDHVERLNESDQFCLVTESGGHLLYRYGSCRPGDIRERPDVFIELFYGGELLEAVEDEIEPDSEDLLEAESEDLGEAGADGGDEPSGLEEQPVADLDESTGAVDEQPVADLGQLTDLDDQSGADPGTVLEEAPVEG